MSHHFVTQSQPSTHFGCHFGRRFANFGVHVGHFGYLGTSLGSHGSPRRPPERPGVPFGWIRGSFWSQVWGTFGAKMTPESMSTK